MSNRLPYPLDKIVFKGIIVVGSSITLMKISTPRKRRRGIEEGNFSTTGRIMIECENITIAEMARRLGVSTATVGKVLNGKGRISPETSERVRNLARELNYTPNLAARSLRTNVKDTVGLLITSDIVNPWYSQLVSLLEEELSRRNWKMLLTLGKNDPEKSEHALENFFGGRVCGILAGPIFLSENQKILHSAIERQIPLVAFNNLQELSINYVAIDQAAGASMAIEYLYSLGHRRIYYMRASHGDEEKNTQTRYSGYLSTMQKYGLEPKCLYATQSTGRQNGYELTNQLLNSCRKQDLPTAMFCHNDDTAFGVMLALQQAGLRIPDDISLVGFDDIAESNYSIPGLTTVGGVMNELAVELVSALEKVMEERNQLIQKLITPQLIIRGSAAGNNIQKK